MYLWSRRHSSKESGTYILSPSCLPIRPFLPPPPYPPTDPLFSTPLDIPYHIGATIPVLHLAGVLFLTRSLLFPLPVFLQAIGYDCRRVIGVKCTLAVCLSFLYVMPRAAGYFLVPASHSASCRLFSALPAETLSLHPIGFNHPAAT